MRCIPLLLFFCLASFFSKSQDLIVKVNGDSLNVRITKLRSEYVFYSYYDDGHQRNAVLSRQSVRDYKYNFYSTETFRAADSKKYMDFTRWRIAANGGWGRRIAADPVGANALELEYIDGLRSGIVYGVEGNYFFTSFIGIGLEYNSFHASNSLNNVTVTFPNLTKKTGTVSDKISINFFSPSFVFRVLSPTKRNAFVMSGAIGYCTYSDEAVVITPLKREGSTIGIAYHIGYDLALDEHFSIGGVLSASSAVLTSVTIIENGFRRTETFSAGQYESLARIDFCLGLRYR